MEASLGRPGCSACRRSATVAPAPRCTWKTLLTDLGASFSWSVLIRTWSLERPSGRSSGNLSHTSEVLAPMRSLSGTGSTRVHTLLASSGSSAASDSACSTIAASVSSSLNIVETRRRRSASVACSAGGTQRTSAEIGSMPTLSSIKLTSSAAVAPAEHSRWNLPEGAWTANIRSRRCGLGPDCAFSLSRALRVFGKRRMYSSKTGRKSATSRSETSSRESRRSTRCWASEVFPPCCR
mmetsp:Transcript_106042/g.337778  ORF Transcript_106042/g.337778 Transcript_106042/m.337778 type:complete len:238 (+) Transcript_106042:546-1259(+)